MATVATAVVIFMPPLAPNTSFTFPELSVIIEGHIDESGRFPADNKLRSDAG